MLGLRDTFILATTKLRVRRVRLTVTLVVAGLLFTTLVFGSLVIRGSLNSLESFTKEGLLSQFITTVQPVSSFELATDKTYIARAEAIEKVRLEAQVKEAQRLGLPFDPKTQPKAVTEGQGPNGKMKYLELSHPAAKQAVAELARDTQTPLIQEAIKSYATTGLYSYQHVFAYSFASAYELTPLVNGKEQKSLPLGQAFGVRDSTTTFKDNMIAIDNEMLKPFTLAGVDLATKAGEPIPILAPIDAVEKFVKLDPLPKDASAKAKVERLKQLRTLAKNLTFEACYRNNAALNLRDTAKQQAEEMASRKNDATYQKPSLLYGEGAADCKPQPIVSDTRSAIEKAQIAKEEQFARTFGAEQPDTQRISFRVVGIMPQLGTLYNASGFEGFLTGLLSSSLGEGWFISREAALTHPIFKSLLEDPVALGSSGKQLYVNFADRANQKRFIEEKSCNNNAFAETNCPEGQFYTMPFGNPLATLYDTAPQLKKTVSLVIGIIALLAAIVMIGTIGKVVADSRKETSIFRAVGAKRHNIAQIYLLYTGILGSLAFLIALAIGIIAAIYIETRYSANLSAQAVLVFNASDLGKQFHLLGLNIKDLLVIYGFVLAVSLLSACIPLLTNLRRNPVKDMREE